MSRKILITGGSGTLGQYLNFDLSKTNEILTIYNSHPRDILNYPHQMVNLAFPKQTAKLIRGFKPDVIIHLASYSNPEACRNASRTDVLNLNVNATELIAKICQEINCKLIFTSTDLVYKSSPELKAESSKLEPLSLYAETKISAEEKIRENCKDHIILRTSLLYGIALFHSKNHFTQMVNDLRNKKAVNLFSDQYRTPLSLKNAAELIGKIVSSDISNETLNFGGNEKLSRYELGMKAAEATALDSSLINGVSFNEIADTISFSKESPPDVSMDNSKLKGFGIVPKDTEEALRETINNM